MDFHARSWFETLSRRWAKCPACALPAKWRLDGDVAVCQSCGQPVAVGDDPALYKKATA